MIVHLTKGELQMAKAVGQRRQESAKKAGRAEAHGHTDDEAKGTWDHILGATGECAAAKGLNRFWFQPVFADRHLGDIGVGLHVRSTDWKTGSLIVHESDPDDGVFILAIQDGSIPERWDIIGWIVARDAKKEEHWWDITRTKRPAYFVPQWELKSMELLVTWLDERRGEYV